MFYIVDLQEVEYSYGDCNCPGVNSTCRCNRQTGQTECLCEPGHYRAGNGTCTSMIVMLLSSVFSLEDVDILHYGHSMHAEALKFGLYGRK